MSAVILGNLCHLGERLSAEIPDAYCFAFAPPYFPAQKSRLRTYWELLRARTVVSIAGAVSARSTFVLFRVLRWLHLAPRLVSYTTGGDLEQSVRNWSSCAAERKRIDQALQWSDRVIVSQFEHNALNAAKRLRLKNLDLVANPASVGAPGEVPLPVRALRASCRFLVYLAAAPDRGGDRNKGSAEAWLALQAFAEKHPDAAILVRQLEHVPSIVFARARQQVMTAPTYDAPTFWAVAQQANVVVDQFGLGITGLVSFEAALLGTPVVTRVDTDVEAIYGEKCPMFTARTADEILAQLERIYAMPKADLWLRYEAARLWVEKHHSPRQIAKIAECVR